MFSGMHVLPGQLWKKIYMDSLRKANVFVVVENEAMYASPICLEEIVAAANNGLSFVVVRAQAHNLPPAEAQWQTYRMYTDADIELAQEKIASAPTIPDEGSFQDNAEAALPQLLSVVANKLGKHI